MISLEIFYKLFEGPSLKVKMRGLRVLFLITDRKERDQLIVRRLREELFQLRSVKVRDPGAPKPEGFYGEHHMTCDDSGIHLGEILSIEFSDPALLFLRRDEEKERGSDKGLRGMRRMGR